MDCAMRTQSWLVVIIGTFVSGWLVEPAHADDREPPLAPPPFLASNARAMPVGDAAPAPVPESGASVDGTPARRHPVCDWLRALKPACWSHHNYFGCGNCKSECTFIFGSCRAFYGEPCLRGPQSSPGPIDCLADHCHHCP